MRGHTPQRIYSAAWWGREIETRRALGTSPLTMDERLAIILRPTKAPKPEKTQRVPAALRPCSLCGERPRLPWASRCEPCWAAKLVKQAGYKRERRALKRTRV